MMHLEAIIERNKPNPEEPVLISAAEYGKLLRAQKKLAALEGGGVDNWEGYGDAIQELYADDAEDEL